MCVCVCVFDVRERVLTPSNYMHCPSGIQKKGSICVLIWIGVSGTY